MIADAAARRAAKSTARRRALALVCVTGCWSCSRQSSPSSAARRRSRHLVSTDGITTLATTGTVTPGPYTSGQSIEITGTANSTLSNANLVANSVPGQATGNPIGAFYFEECTDPDGLTANLPTTSNGCEAATDDFTSVHKSPMAPSTTRSYAVYDLPDPGTLGSPTMVGSCDVAPNTCVVGIFAANPRHDRVQLPPPLLGAVQRRRSATADDLGDSPGDGSPPRPRADVGGQLDRCGQPDHRDGRRSEHLQVTVSLKDTNGNPVTTPKIRHPVARLGQFHHRGQRHCRVDGDDRFGRTGGLHRQRHHRRVGHLHGDGHDRQQSCRDPDADGHLCAPVATPSNSSMIAASSAVPNGATPRSPSR